jgi:hypothetical protein
MVEYVLSLKRISCDLILLIFLKSWSERSWIKIKKERTHDEQKTDVNATAKKTGIPIIFF